MKTQKSLVAYLAIPVKFHKVSMIIQSRLEAEGMIAKNPCTLVAPELPKEKISGYCAESCYEMIESADFLVLYSDYYGLDCAAEVGYTVRSLKPIFPFSFEGKESEMLFILT